MDEPEAPVDVAARAAAAAQAVAYLPTPWVVALQQLAAGQVDALDLWHAIDELVTGTAQYPRALVPHAPDVMGREEYELTYAQADELALLLAGFFTGRVSADETTGEAFEILGLAAEE
jgi:hypothetical protein